MSKASLIATFTRLRDESRQTRIDLAEELANAEFGPVPSPEAVESLIERITVAINEECSYIVAINLFNSYTEEEMTAMGNMNASQFLEFQKFRRLAKDVDPENIKP